MAGDSRAVSCAPIDSNGTRAARSATRSSIGNDVSQNGRLVVLGMVHASQVSWPLSKVPDTRCLLEILPSALSFKTAHATQSQGCVSCGGALSAVLRSGDPHYFTLWAAKIEDRRAENNRCIRPCVLQRDHRSNVAADSMNNSLRHILPRGVSGARA